MSTNHEEVRAIAQMKVSRIAKEREEPLTSDEIRSIVEGAVTFAGVADVDVESVVAELETMFATVIGRSSVLRSDDEWNPWLKARSSEIDWSFWSRYRKHLLLDKGWASSTIDRMDEITDEALGLLNDPQKQGSWDRRGLIVGDVQSGKTSNYVGLICKAADAGYKVIVVLAGFHKSLRSQTQIRLEEGFLGYDRTQTDEGGGVGLAGVGYIDPTPKANTITNRSDGGDFQRAIARQFGIQPGGHPLLFVIKKNAHVLRNLLSWVRSVAAQDTDGAVLRDIPLLVIDDEADQGSIDTSKQEFDSDGNPDQDHDPKAINRLIRSLLKLFDQHAYVGYTATPFANIFIHEKGRTKKHGEDLFPKSFILSLPTPSNHIGPSTVFGYEAEDGTVVEGLPMIRAVDDHGPTRGLDERVGWMPPRHNKHHVPLFRDSNELPPSLRDAVDSFVLSTAARYARGQETQHNTMLVHVTRFTAVQGRVWAQLRSRVASLKRRLRYGEGRDNDATLASLRELWESDFIPTSRHVVSRGFLPASQLVSWEQLVQYLPEVVDSILIRQINGYAGEVLDYKTHEDTGLNVIAVGGDKLSRGLTLEGLTTSYFLRASKMYDTLMQMGRWFGYRPGYLDLCRLYTTEEMEDWFSHIAKASDELREDFDRMVASGGTPRDFGHRVRSHPTLLVTSAVKMRNGYEIDLTYDGDLSETINFRRDRATIQNNLAAAKMLVRAAATVVGPPSLVSGNSPARIWSAIDGRAVPAEYVLAFLRQYQEHEASKRVKTRLLADYLEEELRRGRLEDWSVFVASGSSTREYDLESVRIKLVERAWHTSETADEDHLRTNNHYRIRRLLNPPDEYTDLSDEEVSTALALTVEEWKANPYSRSKPGEKRARPSQPMGKPIRLVRPESRGHLMIYPLDPGNEVDAKVVPEARDLPVIGFGISFPTVADGRASKVKYTVGNVYWEQEVLGGKEP